MSGTAPHLAKANDDKLPVFIVNTVKTGPRERKRMRKKTWKRKKIWKEGGKKRKKRKRERK